MSESQATYSDIKVAIIGFGLAGRVFHAPFVTSVPGLQLSYIVQRRGDEAAIAYPDATILRSLEEVLSSDAELVIVASPNATHYPFARSCLEAGKHVVVDKPFAATSDEAFTLATIAKKDNLVLSPFHNRRWDGDFFTIQKLLESNAVGRLVNFTARWDRFNPIPRKEAWQETSGPGNGLLFNLGCHLVDQVLALFGIPLKISASVRKDRDGTQIDDAFDIVLHYPRLLVSCQSSLVACDASPRFLLHGTEGSFKKYGLDPQEANLVAGGRVPLLGTDHDWLTEEEAHWGTLTTAPDPRDPKTLLSTKIATLPGDYRKYYVNIRDTILGLTPLAVTPTDGYRLIKLLELAGQSSESGNAMQIKFAI
jgi:predicted dehydrogenase